MVKVYPEELPNIARKDPKKRAEIKLYDALRQQLQGNWQVFYNVAWLGRTTVEGSPRDGETDFIVTHPDHGILLIEVKGGGISYEGSQRQWISTDREGIDHLIDPFDQVIQCKYALINKLKSLPRWSRQWITVFHAVAFPDVNLANEVLPPEAPSEIIIDGKDLTDLPKRLSQIFKYWQGKDQNPQQTNPQLLEDLKKLLATTIKLRNPLSLQVEDDNQEIIRLTYEQLGTLKKMNKIRRAAISGCAGSGKTMMAVEKAQRLANEGFRTLLTCYNNPLAEHLAEVSGKVENLTVCTFHQLCSRMAREADITLPSTTDANSTAVYDKLFPDALYDAMSKRPDLRFDAIIVDEGQDFADTWWIALENSLVEGRKSVFYIFYDDNQRIYHNRGNIPEDLNLVSISLLENVRNTRTIHRALTTYYQGENASQPCGPVGRSIETYNCINQNDLYKTLSQVLNKLTRTEGVSGKDIVILTPKSLKATSPNHSILEDFKLSGDLRLVTKAHGQRNEILYSTIHSFKGLERPVVIVVEIDEQSLGSRLFDRDALCYVAFSRPRSHLIIMGQQPLIRKLLSSAAK